MDSYDNVLKLFSIARAEFGETLSSFELMDNITVTYVERNLQLQCPIANSYQFYVLIELASSQPNVSQHMENVLEKALEDSVIADATTTDQTSSINVSIFAMQTIFCIRAKMIVLTWKWCVLINSWLACIIRPVRYRIDYYQC